MEITEGSYSHWFTNIESTIRASSFICKLYLLFITVHFSYSCGSRISWFTIILQVECSQPF